MLGYWISPCIQYSRGALTQLVECFVEAEKVAGSSPVCPTILSV